MNDRVNGRNPSVYADRLNLSTIGGLMALSELMDFMDDDEKADVQGHVNRGDLRMTDALVAWLVGIFNLGRIDIQQLSDGVMAVHTAHESVMASVYEYVFSAPYMGNIEELMS